MNVYRCEFISIEQEPHFSARWRANVKLLDDHKGFGGQSGDRCTTSTIKLIDFERGIIVTQNSVYIWRR